MVQEDGRVPKILRHVNFATVRAGVLQDTQSHGPENFLAASGCGRSPQPPRLGDAKSHSSGTFPHNEFRNLAASRGSKRPIAMLALVRMMQSSGLGFPSSGSLRP